MVANELKIILEYIIVNIGLQTDNFKCIGKLSGSTWIGGRRLVPIKIRIGSNFKMLGDMDGQILKGVVECIHLLNDAGFQC